MQNGKFEDTELIKLVCKIDKVIVMIQTGGVE